MRPSLWQPSVELSTQEERIMKRIRKAKLFAFLRQHRHESLDEAFQQELANLYRKATNAAGTEERLTVKDRIQFTNDWSPDGRYLLFQEQDPDTRSDL